MPAPQQMLYNAVCDFVKEPHAIVGAQTPLAKRIAAREEDAARWLLEQHPWNFPSRTERLTINTTADPDADEVDASLAGYKYRYNKPALRRINYVATSARERDRITSGWVDKGGFIYSDHNPLYLDFVDATFALPAKMGHWPQSFLTADASLIADVIIGPVANSRGWESDMSARSQALIEAAYTYDAGQSPAPTRRQGRFLNARRGGRTFGEA